MRAAGEAPAVLAARSLEVVPAGSATPVLENLSFRLAPGDWVALTGPNGSGKTSLALVLAGLRRPRSGTVSLEGRTDDAGVRVAVAAVLQEPESQLLQPSVREELAFASRNLGRHETEIAASLARWAEALGLVTDLDREPRTLSAGRQQIVAIAAALVAGPRVLVLDEAGAFLDASSRRDLLLALRREVEQGLAVLWITQEAEEIAAADRLWELVPASGAAGRHTLVDGRPSRSAARTDAGAARPAPISSGIAERTRRTALARVRIHPAHGESGPRIDVAAALEFELPRSGVVAILGRNGAGKSVLLSAACGVHRLDQLEVEWAERPEPAPLLAFQYPELQIFEERAVDEVVFTAVSRGVSRAAALEAARRALAALGPRGTRLLDQRSHELSAGEKRILTLVGTLIAPATLWALDEPTAGLDPEAREWLMEQVVAAAGRGPFLIGSQDVGWIDRMGAVRHVLGGWEVPWRQ